MLDWELYGVGPKFSQVSHNPELKPTNYLIPRYHSFSRYLMATECI
jgi:hypothetical protein